MYDLDASRLVLCGAALCFVRPMLAAPLILSTRAGKKAGASRPRPTFIHVTPIKIDEKECKTLPVFADDYRVRLIGGHYIFELSIAPRLCTVHSTLPNTTAAGFQPQSICTLC